MSLELALMTTVAAAGAVAVPGAVQRRRHRDRLHRIPVRVNVNGHRGKTTVTRLLVGALSASRTTVGKTTGTVPRLIRAPGWTEWEVRRGPGSANIREQIAAAKFAAWQDAEVFVSECMAVRPEYQVVFQDEMVDATIGVITNVLRDHLAEMGPTVNDAADALAAAIPVGGIAVTVQGPLTDRLRDHARRRRAKLVVVDSASIDSSRIEQFDHLVFNEHVALALAVAETVGIDRDVAWSGMLAARPDPYATRTVPIGDPAIPARFVNGFAINDPDSTLALWHRLVIGGVHCTADVHPTIVINCRNDRLERSEQLAHVVLPQTPAAELVVIGSGCEPILDAHHRGRLAVGSLTDLRGADIEAVVEAIDASARARPGSAFFGIGNLQGVAMELVDQLGAAGEDTLAGSWPPVSATGARQLLNQALCRPRDQARPTRGLISTRRFGAAWEPTSTSR